MLSFRPLFLKHSQNTLLMRVVRLNLRTENFRKEGVDVGKMRNVPSERYINKLCIRCQNKFCLIHGIIFEANLLPKNHTPTKIPTGEKPKHDMKPDDLNTLSTHTNTQSIHTNKLRTSCKNVTHTHLRRPVDTCRQYCAHARTPGCSSSAPRMLQTS